MDTLIRARNVQAAMPVVFSDILTFGKEYSSRNGKVKECLGAKIVLEQPRERYSIVGKRKADPIALTMETLWVLSGRDDIEWLSRYLPRAKNYSDDGAHWRAAYGPRLRGWNGGVDQVEAVIGELNEHPDTRRAVISLWYPGEDSRYPESKDYPCNNWLQFQIRDGRLHMFVTARSNDAMWGWSGINTFEWSVLHEIVANSTSTEVGEVTYFIGNLHLYDWHWDQATQVVEQVVEHGEGPTPYGGDPEVYDRTYGTDLTLEELDVELFSEGERWWQAEERAYQTGKVDLRPFVDDRFLRDALLMAAIRGCINGTDAASCDPIGYLNQIEAEDAKTAVADWLARITIKNAEKIGAMPTAFFTRDGSTYIRRQEYLTRCLQHLVAVKNATYRDSWKRRGELFSIFPNVCRKWDRLVTLWDGGTDGAGESYYDTLLDLVNYCALWSDWLVSGGVDNRIADIVREAQEILNVPKTTQGRLIQQATAAWGMLEQAMDNQAAQTSKETPGWKFTKLREIAVPCIQMLMLDWEGGETADQVNDVLENIEGMTIPTGVA